MTVDGKIICRTTFKSFVKSALVLVQAYLKIIYNYFTKIYIKSKI